ncbi:tRNA (adenine(22)-N(1))-methyltransferase [Listeria costaricensis]|uniref:tRNA (adenine(22)-N(1))-methyltransferase n=1 Tax=Listeria costaricensis TaxID=2026604 RepID=UPI000C07EDA7|nr:tRNA (adenine(22)-N(1))-methyltransferase TrmK [Listeria costaricensis]
MNEQHLSKRLQKVVSYLPEGTRLADIGSDHAYLPCYAVLNGQASYAIAGEVVEGPFQSAKKQVEKLQLAEQIHVRKGDGLSVLTAEDQIDTIVIAGMGGSLIRSILEKDPSKLAGVKRLVLQPNLAAHKLRSWAETNQFALIAEAILMEDQKIYEILVLEKTEQPVHYTEKECFFGPFLLAEKNEAFRAKWLHEKENWQKIIQTIEEKSGAHAENQPKLKELTHKIQLVEDVIV